MPACTSSIQRAFCFNQPRLGGTGTSCWIFLVESVEDHKERRLLHAGYFLVKHRQDKQRATISCIRWWSLCVVMTFSGANKTSRSCWSRNAESNKISACPRPPLKLHSFVSSPGTSEEYLPDTFRPFSFNDHIDLGPIVISRCPRWFPPVSFHISSTWPSMYSSRMFAPAESSAA